jgi:hypothetical protein
MWCEPRSTTLGMCLPHGRSTLTVQIRTICKIECANDFHMEFACEYFCISSWPWCIVYESENKFMDVTMNLLLRSLWIKMLQIPLPVQESQWQML